jgi:hypothetical protein
MTFDIAAFRADLEAELARLGLDPRDVPLLGGSAGGLQDLLRRVRTMEPGVTWHDVLPDLPADFVPGDWQSWLNRPIRFHPLGAFDYQELPVGPALHIHFRDKSDSSALETFVAAAREQRFPIYGAGLISMLMSNPDWPTMDAHVVLRRDISDDQYADFTEWIAARQGVEVAVFTRSGRENYSVD